jgi:hypothetical protein
VDVAGLLAFAVASLMTAGGGRMPTAGAAVRVAEPPVVVPGAGLELSVTILETPAPGVPLTADLQSLEVALAENRLDRDHVVDPQAQQPRLRVRATAPDRAGTYRVEGWVSYVVCDERACRPRRVAVTWTVRVAVPDAGTH